MAILKSVVDVNNGNTGWTNSDVMDALETVFANLGFHGGSSSSGVPQSLRSPDNFVGLHESWRSCGGGAVYRTKKTHRYLALANGTTAYRMLKLSNVSSVYHFYSENDSNYPNQIRIDDHKFTQGQAIHWSAGGTVENYNVAGLTLDTVYYVIVVNNNFFKLAANATDAANGTEITLLNGGWGGTQYAAKSNTVYGFRDIDDAQFDNRTIDVGSSDNLEITLDTAGSGNMYLCYNTDDYDAAKHIGDGWGSEPGYPGQTTTYTNPPTGMGSDTGAIVWDVNGYRQSFTDPADKELFHPTESLGSRKYIYANDTNPGMKGVINVYPQVVNGYNSVYYPFWDYEVPANGGRSALKLRVYRYQESSGSYYGRIAGIDILNKGTGWTNNEVFTIPGDQIGGATPASDIVFGNRVDGSDQAGDGTPSLQTTSLGSGSNFYQKADSGRWAVLKNVNDASKTYGTTYYTFGLATDVNNKMMFNSASGYRWINLKGTQESSGNNNAGRFAGNQGLDFHAGYTHPVTTSYNSYWEFPHITYCTSSTPTAYPLEIRVYRAQAPQDTNFAIIQFCQTINNIVQPYGAFTIYKGATFGSNVFDFEYVFNGSMMIYDTGTRSIRLDHTSCSPKYSRYSTDYSTNEEPVSNDSIAREAFYGYLRDPNGPDVITRSEYVCNIETDSSNTSQMYLYYRNSSYDRNGSNAVASEADYYKPFKGLPINERMVPCPYYIPDDFVMLQVSTTPGLTQFRTGDTVTIGGTETYEIIRASYQTQQNGLDGVDNNSTIGMLFLARIS